MSPTKVSVIPHMIWEHDLVNLINTDTGVVSEEIYRIDRIVNDSDGLTDVSYSTTYTGPFGHQQLKTFTMRLNEVPTRMRHANGTPTDISLEAKQR